MHTFRRSFTAPGAAPGELVVPVHDLAPKVSTMTFDAASYEELADVAPEQIEVREGKDVVTWIDVRGLGDGSIVAQLGSRLGLHPLALSDVVNLGQRPKVELYGDVLFVVIRMVTLTEDDSVGWEQVSLFAGKNFVLTFQESYPDCLEPLRKRIRAGRPNIRSGGTDYLACMVIDAIVDGYFPALERFGTLLDHYEESILAGGESSVLTDLYRTKRDLSGFRRAAWPLREALSFLIRDESGFLDDHAKLHLRDTLDHTMQVVDVNESYRELSASLADVHLSIVGQRTNDVMKVLTVVSAIFIPLSFVAGVYGMNFDTSKGGNLPELGWRFGYVYFWGVCLSIAGVLLLLFRRLGWLSR